MTVTRGGRGSAFPRTRLPKVRDCALSTGPEPVCALEPLRIHCEIAEDTLKRLMRLHPVPEPTRVTGKGQFRNYELASSNSSIVFGQSDPSNFDIARSFKSLPPV